jgi:paraquat-inducible protein A
MSINPALLVACRECDLLMREIPLLPGKTAVCRCCGSTLYRNIPESISRTLALALAALIFFVISNVYPILGIEVQGVHAAVNLSGAVLSLWNQGMPVISALVCITTIILPAVEITMLIYLLLPLRFNCVPPGTARILRIKQCFEPWSMVEVFMLGILVSIVKLNDLADLIPGVALWSFGGLTLLLAFVASYFNHRRVWAYLDQQSVNGAAV